MFEQYTEKAAHVLKQAKKVSAELGQNYVGTEHILIALLREGGCAAAELLEDAAGHSELGAAFIDYNGTAYVVAVFR